MTRYLTCAVCQRTDSEEAFARAGERRGTAVSCPESDCASFDALPPADVAARLRAAGRPIQKSSLLHQAVNDGAEHEITGELFEQMLGCLPPALMGFTWGGKRWSFGFAEGAELIIGFRKSGRRPLAQQTDLWPGEDPRPEPEVPEVPEAEGVLRTWMKGGNRFNGSPAKRRRLLHAIEEMRWQDPDGDMAMMPGMLLKEILRTKFPGAPLHALGLSNGMAPLGLVAVELATGRYEGAPSGRLRFYFVDHGDSASCVLVESRPHPADHHGARIRFHRVCDAPKDGRALVVGVQAYAYCDGALLCRGPEVRFAPAPPPAADDDRLQPPLFQAGAERAAEAEALRGLHAALDFEAGPAPALAEAKVDAE